MILNLQLQLTPNLQAIGLEQSQLTQITKGAIGAWARYGDSIPIDGLAESINETIKTGTVTGNFADMLNWAGTSEDEFNEKLEQCSDNSERAQLVLDEMANQGLMKSADAWNENNKALVESNKAQDDYNEAMADFSKAVMPVFTEFTKALTTIIQIFSELPEPNSTNDCGLYWDYCSFDYNCSFDTGSWRKHVDGRQVELQL